MTYSIRVRDRHPRYQVMWKQFVINWHMAATIDRWKNCWTRKGAERFIARRERNEARSTYRGTDQ